MSTHSETFMAAIQTIHSFSDLLVMTFVPVDTTARNYLSYHTLYLFTQSPDRIALSGLLPLPSAELRLTIESWVIGGLFDENLSKSTPAIPLPF